MNKAPLLEHDLLVSPLIQQVHEGVGHEAHGIIQWLLPHTHMHTAYLSVTETSSKQQADGAKLAPYRVLLTLDFGRKYQHHP